MQITITQDEIETAIRNHILGLISVRENMRIDIDLRATRGDAGFTAIVDILPFDGPEGGEKSNSVAVTKVVAKSSNPEAPKEKPQATKAEAEPVNEDVQDEAEAEPIQETKPATKKGVLPFAKKEEEAAPVSSGEAPKSIFAGLKKPVNTPTPTPEAANG